jgi:hypothetical protein
VGGCQYPLDRSHADTIVAPLDATKKNKKNRNSDLYYLLKIATNRLYHDPGRGVTGQSQRWEFMTFVHAARTERTVFAGQGDPKNAKCNPCSKYRRP